MSEDEYLHEVACTGCIFSADPPYGSAFYDIGNDVSFYISTTDAWCRTEKRPAPLALVDPTFSGVIDHPDNVARRSRFLVAIRAALDSNVDIAAELGFAHPDAVVREFLVAVKKRLRDQLDE